MKPPTCSPSAWGLDKLQGLSLELQARAWGLDRRRRLRPEDWGLFSMAAIDGPVARAAKRPVSQISRGQASLCRTWFMLSPSSGFDEGSRVSMCSSKSKGSIRLGFFEGSAAFFAGVSVRDLVCEPRRAERHQKNRQTCDTRIVKWKLTKNKLVFDFEHSRQGPGATQEKANARSKLAELCQHCLSGQGAAHGPPSTSCRLPRASPPSRTRSPQKGLTTVFP